MNIDIVKRDTINNTVGRPSVGMTSARCGLPSGMMRATDHVTFLRRTAVCLVETAVLSKSSTLTRKIDRSCNKYFRSLEDGSPT